MFAIYADGDSIYDPQSNSLYLFSPKLKLEFGKSGSLEFAVPPDHFYYADFKQLKTIITVELDDVEIFRGRVLNTEIDFNKMKTVYCEGDLSYLVDTVQQAKAFKGNVGTLFSQIIHEHNVRVGDSSKQFEVGWINSDIANRSVILSGKSEQDDGEPDPDIGDNFDYKQIALDSIVDEWNTTWDYIQNVIIDYCGGYLKTRRENNTTYIDYFKTRNRNDAIKNIEFGVNLLDLEQEIEVDEFFTVLVPIGDENLTIASVNNGSDEIADSDLVQQYGRIVRSHVFSNVNNANTLLENARLYMRENCVPRNSFTVRAIDLSILDANTTPIYIGDRVQLKSGPHGVKKTLVCTEIEYDIANPENDTYTFGNPKQTLTRRYKEDQRKQNDTFGGGGAGSTAAEAGNSGWHLVEDELDKREKKMFDEWVDWDPENPDGKVSIGALARKIENDRETLKTVGIDLDATTGNISIRSLAQMYNELEQLVGENSASINTLADEQGASVGLIAEYKDALDETNNKVASLTVSVEKDLPSQIKGVADKITFGNELQETVDGIKDTLKKKAGIDIDTPNTIVNINTLRNTVNDQGRTIKSIGTDIASLSNDLGSQIRLEARHYSDHTGKIASITAKANANESAIALKADTVTVDGKLKVINGAIEAAQADIENLKAKSISAESIRAIIGNMDVLSVKGLTASSNVTAGSIYVQRNGINDAVATLTDLRNIKNSGSPGNLHYHTVTVDANGTVTLGSATSSPQSFRIADTKAYKDGVSAAAQAVKIVNFDRKPNTGDTMINTDSVHKYIVHAQAQTSNDNGATILRTYEQTFEVDAGGIYNKGVEKGSGQQAAAIEAAVNAVGLRSAVLDNNRSVTLYTENSVHKISVPVSATLSNDNSYTPTVYADIESIYSNIRATVNITSVGQVATGTSTGVINLGSIGYNDSTHTTSFMVKAQADNNHEKIVTINTNDTAWQKGKAVGETIGLEAAEVTSITVKSGTYSEYTKLIPLTVKATIGKTGKSLTKDNFTVNGKPAFDHGEKVGKAGVKVTSITKTTGNYDANTNLIPLSVTATADNGNSKTVDSFTVNALPAYNAAKDKYEVKDLKIVSKPVPSADGKTEDCRYEIKVTPLNKDGVPAGEYTEVQYTTTTAYENGKKAGSKEASAAYEVKRVNVVSPGVAKIKFEDDKLKVTELNVQLYKEDGGLIKTLKDTDFEINATAAITAVEGNVTVGQPYRDTSVDYSYPYNQATKRYDQVKAKVVAAASNGKSNFANLTFDAGFVYEKGKAKGKTEGEKTGADTVTVGQPYRDTSVDYSYPFNQITKRKDQIKAKIVAEASNGKSNFKDITYDAGYIYDTGYASGWNDGYAAGAAEAGTPVLHVNYIDYEHRYVIYATCGTYSGRNIYGEHVFVSSYSWQ